jgi:iron transport multicopper oxidase
MANGFTTENQFATSEHTYVLNRNDIIELHVRGPGNGIAFILF